MQRLFLFDFMILAASYLSPYFAAKQSAAVNSPTAPPKKLPNKNDIMFIPPALIIGRRVLFYSAEYKLRY